MSAYAEVVDGIQPEIMVESNYKHLSDGVDRLLTEDGEQQEYHEQEYHEQEYHEEYHEQE